MTLRKEIPYPAFDDLFLYCNRMFGQLDGALKKSTPRLTITALQVLTQIALSDEKRIESTQARIAKTIGLSPSSLVTTIRGLEANGLVTVKRYDDTKNKPLSLTKAGHQALRRGLVIRHDVLESFNANLPSDQRRQFFAALRAANQDFDRLRREENEDRYLKSLRIHKTRDFVRKIRLSK